MRKGKNMKVTEERSAEQIIEEVLERGYKEYPPATVIYPHSTRMFQKRFRDEQGRTKYFIDVNMYPEFIHGYNGEVFGPTFEMALQMYRKGTHDPINILFFSSWELEDVEQFVEKMFSSGDFDYYDEED